MPPSRIVDKFLRIIGMHLQNKERDMMTPETEVPQVVYVAHGKRSRMVLR